MAYSSGVPASKKSTSSTPSPSVTCTSNSTSKVLRDHMNLKFIDIDDNLNELKEYTLKYTLDDLAECLGFQIEGSELSADVYAKHFTDPSNYDCDLHSSFIFNGINVDKLIPFYDTKHNTADVTVRLNTGETTYLVSIEVNSSPMSETVLKVIHGLIQLLHVAKALGIENDQLKLQGFALPK